MSTRSVAWEFEFDPYDQVCGPFDGDFDFRELSRDIHRTVWDSSFGTSERFGVRRQIERRNDRKDMHSSLDVWDWGVNPNKG